jgi:predicted DNA-binding transcriptional regulator AlpA
MLRFPDLIARGLFNSRMTLKRAIDTQGFPPGILITPNARAWEEAEVDAWLASRPSGKKIVSQKATSAASAARKAAARQKAGPSAATRAV